MPAGRKTAERGPTNTSCPVVTDQRLGGVPRGAGGRAIAYGRGVAGRPLRRVSDRRFTALPLAAHGWIGAGGHAGTVPGGRVTLRRQLNAYYTQWFKTGKQPAIVRDTLYYFYRKNRTDVDPGKGVTWSFRRDGATAANDIELLAFLAAPGTLRITVAGKVHEMAAPRGITSFKVPMPKDTAFVPEFALLRGGKPVVAKPGHFAVLDKVEYPNMLYGSGVIAPERAGRSGWRRLWR